MSGLSNLDQNTLKTLENLKQFETFFNMIKNPDNYVNIISDAKATLEAIKAATEPYSTVKLAEEYLEKSKAFAAELTTKSLQEQEASKQKADQLVAKAKASKDEADALKQEAFLNMKDAEALKNSYEKSLESINASKQELSLRLQNLSLREAACRDKEKELEQKSNKLKEIMGVQ